MNILHRLFIRAGSLTFIALLCILVRPSLVGAMDVLLLHGTDGPTRWAATIAEGISAEMGTTATVRREYLGAPGQSEEHYYAKAQELSKQPPPQAVVAIDETATAFAIKYKEEVFPEGLLVIAGLDRMSPERLSMCGQCTFLDVEQDLNRVVKLIFTLRPETRVVVGLTDGSAAGQALKEEMERTMQPYKAEADLVFPGYEPGDDGGLDFNALGDVVGSIPSNGVAVLLRFSEDVSGEAISEKQIVGLFESRNVSPVFVLNDALLGSGVVGGVLVTGESVGRHVAKLIQRVQEGEPATELLPEPVPAQVVFDQTALARFGMRPTPDATVINPLDAPSESDTITGGHLPFVGLGALVFCALFLYLRRDRQSS